MKTLLTAVFATGSMLTTGVSLAQSGNMMNGSTWGFDGMGGYGGVWMPILLVIVVVGLVVWVVKQKGK